MSSSSSFSSSSSSSFMHKKFIARRRVVEVVDAGCSCGRPKLSSLFSSKAEKKRKKNEKKKKKKKNKKEGRVEEESVAIVKESMEPFVDFRDSMVQMIVEKELYGWDDLNELLHRFLALNSPCHHHLILGAFADIWDGVLS